MSAFDAIIIFLLLFYLYSEESLNFLLRCFPCVSYVDHPSFYIFYNLHLMVTP